MDTLLLALLDALDAVGENHEEIYDTVCREKMGEPIFYLFIKPDAEYVVPGEFGLFDAAANLAVRQALVTYVTAAKSRAIQLGIDTFHDRMAAFQNNDIESNRERNYFDDFFGWMNPDSFDENGDVIDNP